jgi:antitoxin MazE
MSLARMVKWGNSLAVRIPKTIAQEAGVREGDAVIIRASAEGIEVRRADAIPTLEQLVAEITSDNRYGEITTRERGRERVEW